MCVVQWNPALHTDTRLLRTILFVPTTHLFSYNSLLNTDTWIIRTLFHVPLVLTGLTGFHCTVEPRFNEVPGTGEIGSLNREPRYNEFVEN